MDINFNSLGHDLSIGAGLQYSCGRCGGKFWAGDFANGTVPWCPNGPPPPVPDDGTRCECGARSLGILRGQPGHSGWCPWREIL